MIQSVRTAAPWPWLLGLAHVAVVLVAVALVAVVLVVVVLVVGVAARLRCYEADRVHMALGLSLPGAQRRGSLPVSRAPR